MTGRTYEHTLAAGPWSRTPEPGSPRTRVFDLGGRLRTDTLYVETDNGEVGLRLTADARS